MNINLQPEITVQNAKKVATLDVGSYALLIAPTTGTSADKELVVNIKNNEINEKLGEGSLASIACHRFKEYNKNTRLDVICLKEPSSGGVAAEGSINITGTATENGYFVVRILDDQFEYGVQVAKDDTGSAILAKLKDIAQSTSNPFVLEIDSSNPNILRVKSRMVGTSMNKTTIFIPNRIAGLTINTVQLTGGAGAYDISGIFDNLNQPYRYVIFDHSVDIKNVNDYLNKNFALKNHANSGIGFVMYNGAADNIAASTLFALGDSERKCMVMFANADEQKTNCIPILFSAELAAKSSLRYVTGADISGFMRNPNIRVGGIEVSAIPYHNTIMSYYAPNGELTEDQSILFKEEGVSVVVYDRFDPEKSCLSTVRVLYSKKNDELWLNTLDCEIHANKYLYQKVFERYSQFAASEGGFGANVVTPPLLEGFIKTTMNNLQTIGIVSSSEESNERINSTLNVTFNNKLGLFRTNVGCILVSQFRGAIFIMDYTL